MRCLDDMGSAERTPAGLRELPRRPPRVRGFETASERSEEENALAIITDTGEIWASV